MDKDGIIPKLKPTVPTADAVSNKDFIIGMLSAILITIPPNINKNVYINSVAEADLATSLDSLLLNKFASCLFLKTATAVENNTATVVTFIPPAVEPGAAPISIKIIVINCPTPDNWFKSTVLKPAVLGDTV